MSLNSTPGSERIHIGFFGCRNAGKSSVVNAVTGQDMALVSDVLGTTTDPVTKAMELLPLGPVMIIDTPGFDDEGKLGELRIIRTKKTLNKTDIAVLVIDSTAGMNESDRELLEIFKEKNIPYVIVYNKCDLLEQDERSLANLLHDRKFEKSASCGAAALVDADESESLGARKLVVSDSEECAIILVSAETGEGITELKEILGKLAPKEDPDHKLVGNLLKYGDTAVLVCPIDESAPKGRMILPQQQTIRDTLDTGALAYVTRETELEALLETLKEPPAIVITDSQALGIVSKIVPDDVLLTTFSIIMARYKGFLKIAVEGIAEAKHLHEGDTILMAEGCTHHRQCNDIGTVKIPKLLQAYCGCNLRFETCSGREFPEDLSRYAMVIHCGACMNTDRDVQYRMKCTIDQNKPFTNYGITLAQMTGTLERTLRCFPEIHDLL